MLDVLDKDPTQAVPILRIAAVLLYERAFEVVE